MHWYKEGSRQRSKILYVFRTPGGVRVGRTPLEPEILRHIEAQHPDIAFDWKAVLDNQQIVEPAADLRRPRKRKRSEDEGDAAVFAPGDTVKSVAALLGVGQPRPEASQPAPRPQIPAALEGATPDEQIAFLTKWYPIVCNRIPQRTGDAARQEALTALAERLNPATWTDADQITAGLQQAAEALERLSRVFAKRRRRPRKSPRTAAPSRDTAAPQDARAQDAPLQDASVQDAPAQDAPAQDAVPEQAASQEAPAPAADTGEPDTPVEPPSSQS